MWCEALPTGKVLIVSDSNVAELYLDRLAVSLTGWHPDLLVLPAGEEHKNVDTWRKVIDTLTAMGARRDASIVALGGGVIGDLAGFAAASYMRGIRFVQAPTTLLAQVDASVGGKTAVNHPAGKNLIGAFHQPLAVVIDCDTLETLPEREYTAGLAEVVKYGVIRDARFLEWLEENTDAIKARKTEAVLEMISRSVKNKAEVVVADERESGVRATLNFGHTFAHALETQTGYTRYLHGEAVAIGMMAATRLSEALAVCPEGCAGRLEALLQAFGLALAWPGEVSAEASVEAMALDKKAVDSGLRLVLIEDIGRTVIHQGCGRHDILRAIESRMDASQQ